MDNLNRSLSPVFQVVQKINKVSEELEQVKDSAGDAYLASKCTRKEIEDVRDNKATIVSQKTTRKRKLLQYNEKDRGKSWITLSEASNSDLYRLVKPNVLYKAMKEVYKNTFNIGNSSECKIQRLIREGKLFEGVILNILGKQFYAVSLSVKNSKHKELLIKLS